MNLISEFSLISVFGILKYFIVAGSYYFVCYIFCRKVLEKAKIQRKKISGKDIRREIIHSVTSSLIMSVLVFIAIDTDVSGYSRFYRDINDYPLWWLPLSLVLGIVIQDTYFYWLHRLLHHRKIFRRVHIIHHQSHNPSPFASYSFHFFEAIGEGLIIPLMLFMVPFHLSSLYCFIVLTFTINVYGHLGYELAPKWFRTSFLFHVFNTSVYHNLHHSRSHGNFGLYFRFWDKIMKTENPGYTEIYDKIQKQRFNT